MASRSKATLLAQQSLENLDHFITNFDSTLRSSQISRPVSESTDRFVIKNDPDCLLDQESVGFACEGISKHEGEGEDRSDGVCDGLSGDVGGGS